MNVFQEGWINFKSLWTAEKYAGFKGRSSRREFWTTQIYLFIFGLGASLLDWIFTAILSGVGSTGFSFFSTLWTIVIFLPSLALVFRRLHDTGHSGWWSLSSLIVGVFTAIAVAITYCWGIFYYILEDGWHPYMLPHIDATWAFMLLIVIVGAVTVCVLEITVFVFTLLKGQKCENKYGDEKSCHCSMKEASGNSCCCSNDNKSEKALNFTLPSSKDDQK